MPAGHTDRVTSCAFSADGSRIVTGSRDGTLKLWDAESGIELATLDQKAAIARKVGLNRSITYLRDDQGDLRGSFTPQETLSMLAEIKKCAFSPDGSRIIAESTSEQIVWDVATGRMLPTGAGPDDEVKRGAQPTDTEEQARSPWQRGLALQCSVRKRIRSSREKPESNIDRVRVSTAASVIARFPDMRAEITVFAVSPVDSTFVVCDEVGSVHILRLENLPARS